MIRGAHGLARRLLRVILPRTLRDSVLGDLDAEMAERREGGASDLDVLRWGLGQALGSIPAAFRLRLAARRTSTHAPRRMLPGAIMQNLWQDVRYAVRLIRRNPLVSGAAIATLALGIGSTTTIFSVVHATLVRRLPFPEPDRIVRVYETFGNGFTRGVANPSNFDFWERHATSYSHLAAMRAVSATLTGAGDATRVHVQAVTPAFFDAVGVSPAIGRRIAADDTVGTAPPVLLSHELWTTRFGADPSITSRTITLDGTARPILGVMPAGFRFPNDTDLWQGLTLPPELRANARAWFLGVVARLRPGMTIEGANAELRTLAGQLQALHPARQKNRGAYVVALHDDLVVHFADGLSLLQAAVVFVLLIAVANVANLLLTLGAGRQKEISIRTAVGAARWRIVRQLLTESLLLGLAGAAAGALLAFWGLRALLALSPLELPQGMEPAIDGPVLVFALAVGVLTSVIFGVAPAFLVSRAHAGTGIKEGAHAMMSGGRGRAARIRAALVVSEIALAVVLLAGAGLLIRSFTIVMAQQVGFAADRVLTAQTTLPSLKYDTPGKRLQFWQALFERLQSMPDVVAAGASTAVPFSNWEWQTGFRIIGREDVPNDGTSIRVVHPGYFAALGIPVLKGRTFTEIDTSASEPVVVVNEAFARVHLAGLDPVGQRMRFVRSADAMPATIVGVTGDTRHFRLEESARPEVYRALAQAPQQTLVLAIRTSGDPRGAMSLVRSAIQDLDRDLPVERLATLASLIDRTVAERRFYAGLMTFFSLLAAAMAAVGVYGVMAYVVGQRTREIGIRMALGAAPTQVQRMVMRSGGVLILAGIAIGAGGALLSTKVLEAVLFGVTPRDPATMGTVMLALAALAAAATYLPARRARRVDPALALRGE